MTDLENAHATIRAAAADLERDGVDIEYICDALMIAAINGAARVATNEMLANWLEKAATLVRAGQQVTGRTNEIFLLSYSKIPLENRFKAARCFLD